MPYLIEFRHIFKSLGNQPILNDVSFGISRGEIFGIIGKSGSGKTTLLRTLMGYYRPDSGSVIFSGSDVSKDTSLVRKIFGFTSQDDSIYPELTATQNLEYFAELHGMKGKKVAEQTAYLLKLVNLESARNTRASALSGGMRQRLDIACGLVHNPHILIMDEPTAGLDVIIRRDIWKLILLINSQGTTIIFTSHLLDEVELLCKRVAILNRGMLLHVGTPKQLMQLYANKAEIKLETYPGKYKELVLSLVYAKAPLTGYARQGSALVLYTTDPLRVISAITLLLPELNEQLLDIKVGKPGLSEIFEKMMR